MKVLMIGGTRFVGRAAVADLAARGHEVVVLNRGTLAPHPAAARAIQCDKADRGALTQALTGERWDAVIDTVFSAADLEFSIEILAGRVAHFIHTGSTGVYAPCARIPARESDPLALHDAPYSFNIKLQQDQVLMRAHQEHAFPGTALRMCYIYGPGTVLLDGWGGRETRMFQMLRDGEPIPLPDAGRALLHPGYVDDLATAFGDALETPQTIGQIYNIGGDRSVSKRDYIALAARSMGVEARFEAATAEQILERFPEHTSERGVLFSCEHMSADISKAERDMGWRPETPLESGIANSIEWMQAEDHL
jgi:nucleoside-diphosphate-sugar epimerase